MRKKFDSIVPRGQRSKVIAKVIEEVKRHEDKVICLLGSKAEIPHKKRSGRRFVSVRKGIRFPFRFNRRFLTSFGMLIREKYLRDLVYHPKTGDVSIIATERANTVVRIMIFTLFLSISLKDY